MTMFPRILFAATLAALPIAPAAAQDPHGGKPATQEPAKKPDGFAVVKVGEDLKVVAQGEIDNVKKQIQDEHAKAMDEWKAMKKAADAKKEKFDKPEPKPTAFQVVKGGFKSQDEANTFMTAEKAKEKEKGKDKDKPKKDEPKKDEKGGGDKGKEKSKEHGGG
jgi:hypothetical protein